MNKVSFNNKEFELFIDKEKIDEMVNRLANEINLTYSLDDEITMISILDGSFIFMADLVRKLKHNISIQFVKIKSYEGTESNGDPIISLMPHLDIKNKHVIIVEDIIDTGLTIEHFMEELNRYDIKSLKICTLLSKPDVHNDIINIDFLGTEIPPCFVIGYGLDINGQGRQLPHLYRLKV